MKQAPRSYVARLERALGAAATVVALHGDVYAPAMERLADELEGARKKESGADRAKRILASLPAHAVPKDQLRTM